MLKINYSSFFNFLKVFFPLLGEYWVNNKSWVKNYFYPFEIHYWNTTLSEWGESLSYCWHNLKKWTFEKIQYRLVILVKCSKGALIELCLCQMGRQCGTQLGNYLKAKTFYEWRFSLETQSREFSFIILDFLDVMEIHYSC